MGLRRVIQHKGCTRYAVDQLCVTECPCAMHHTWCRGAAGSTLARGDAFADALHAVHSWACNCPACKAAYLMWTGPVRLAGTVSMCAFHHCRVAVHTITKRAASQQAARCLWSMLVMQTRGGQQATSGRQQEASRQH